MFIDVNGWKHIGNIKTSTIMKLKEKKVIYTKKYISIYDIQNKRQHNRNTKRNNTKI